MTPPLDALETVIVRPIVNVSTIVVSSDMNVMTLNHVRLVIFVSWVNVSPVVGKMKTVLSIKAVTINSVKIHVTCEPLVDSMLNVPLTTIKLNALVVLGIPVILWWLVPRLRSVVETMNVQWVVPVLTVDVQLSPVVPLITNVTKASSVMVEYVGKAVAVTLIVILPLVVLTVNVKTHVCSNNAVAMQFAIQSIMKPLADVPKVLSVIHFKSVPFNRKIVALTVIAVMVRFVSAADV